MKKTGTNVIQKVPMTSKRRYFDVLSGNSRPERDVKKKALSPNAASGKAVAVPRWFGQLRAAVLIAAVNAAQLPHPVRNEKKQSSHTPIVPGPASYAASVSKARSDFGNYLDARESILQQWQTRQ
jgi:hypothetical protein